MLFLCFGSARFFTARQAHETAHALDRSGHRFLWVLHGPPEHGTRLSSDGDLAELLPPGFSERTKGRGLVWPKWAPQKEILAHAAVGGFVTHCGWNSVLESREPVVGGMGVAVAMEVRRKEDSFVEAAELERAVRALMGGAEGRAATEKAREMKAACRMAVEEGGSSNVSLQRLCDALHQGAVLPAGKFPQDI
ncbi:baicalein 7-O-glucuronosyltransferase-like [Miscanthus floridulus]|uniref:baicalein 7-O-glucuronosyltransferase-like n=1 Tax=Miscanthus floridulus TaxID=154761 RepID=UPI003459424E